MKPSRICNKKPQPSGVKLNILYLDIAIYIIKSILVKRAPTEPPQIRNKARIGG